MTDHVRARVISSSPPHPAYEGPQDELFDWQKWRRYAAFSLGYASPSPTCR